MHFPDSLATASKVRKRHSNCQLNSHILCHSQLQTKEAFVATEELPEAFWKLESLELMSSARRKRQLLLRSVGRIEQVRPLIREIMDDVQERGDRALLEYTKRFDRIDLSRASICVTKEEIRGAYKKVEAEDAKLIPAMRYSLKRIKAYHQGEMEQLKYGIKKWSKPSGGEEAGPHVGQFPSAIERVGVYVPGGHAVLFSTALMGVTPAKVAGVSEIIVASPPSRNGDIDPKILVAADLAGATQIVRAGGAQAIAALAYGTESVPKVNKDCWPCETHVVAAAKSYVSSLGVCAIDFLAGPSEVLVVADRSALKGERITYIASDMISQAEHDPERMCHLVTDSDQ